MAEAPDDMNGQSSSDQDNEQPLFYSKQVIDKSVMDILQEDYKATITYTQYYDDRPLLYAAQAARSHKDELKKLLNAAQSSEPAKDAKSSESAKDAKSSKLEKDAKSSKLEKDAKSSKLEKDAKSRKLEKDAKPSKLVRVKDSVTDENGSFTLYKIYDNWHNVMRDSVKLQHEAARCLADDWFKELENIGIEDVFKVTEEQSENVKEAADPIASNTTWFLCLAAICATASLLSYSNADVMECVNDYSQCWQNITMTLFDKMFKYYTAFHGITIENEQEL